MNTEENTRFNFGSNWQAFSERALTPMAIVQAQKDFSELFDGIDLAGRSFLDIGFGQGLTLLLATSLGAKTVGCDIDPLCESVLRTNEERFFSTLSDRPITIVGSILDKQVVEVLRRSVPDGLTAYKIVHSWGALHHTGNMRLALHIAASLVAPKGYLIIAIYNRHWSSRAWLLIKRFCNGSPSFIKRLLVAFVCPLIYLAKWLLTRRNPLKKERGMSFYYDVADWVGGYPYEYATVVEINELMKAVGFRLQRCISAPVPTGCNQFVFQRD